MKRGRARLVVLYTLSALVLAACGSRCGGSATVDLQPYSWPQDFTRTPDGRDHGAPCTAESATLAVLSGSSEQVVLAALGVDPATRTDATFHEAEATWSEDRQPVQIWTSHGGLVVVVEPNGFQSSQADRLEAMAHGGDAVSVYWGIASGKQVTVVKDGKTIREFDPGLGPKSGDGDALPEEKGLPFANTRGGGDGEKALAASLVFLQRRLGFAASADVILTGRKPTYVSHAKRGRAAAD